MDTTLLVLAITTIVIVLIFEYTNGFHDAANIIATVIASRAMTPVQAVLLVAFFEFLGPLLGGTAVANTIGTFITLDDLDAVLGLMVVLCGLIGAIAWNLVTWWFGIPSSSSHALVGGLAGVVVVAAGSNHVEWGFADLLHGEFHGVAKVIAALILSPIIGFWVGYVLHRVMLTLLRGAHPSINRDLRHLQYVTSAGLAFSHGANDAQKSMGILTLVLLLGGFIDSFAVPFWVMLACSLAITLGILSGGWQIVRTLGFSIYKIRPLHALDSQMTAAGVIFSSSLFGAPVSTTHVVASSIMGIGASERPKAVRWGKALEIVATWVITIPGAALMAIGCYLVVQLFV
ncbi:MAG: inorganic phosphate transporter [Gammaproteobacteria bacterium]|nr:inorganic phosphate transporter [Gammaproteobacteria bacterium]